MEVALVVGGVGLFALYQWLKTDSTAIVPKKPASSAGIPTAPIVPTTPAVIPSPPVIVPVVVPPVTPPPPVPVVAPPAPFVPNGCSPCGQPGRFWCAYGIGQYKSGVIVSTYRVPPNDPEVPPIKASDGTGLYFRENNNCCPSTGQCITPVQYV